MYRNLGVTILIVVALACGRPDPETLPLRAFGNEPFWNVTLSADGIVYGRMGEADVSFPYESPRHVGDASATRVFGPLRDDSGQHEIEMRISSEDCQDTMADVVHPMRATVFMDGEELTGCARHPAADTGTEAP